MLLRVVPPHVAGGRLDTDTFVPMREHPLALPCAARPFSVTAAGTTWRAELAEAPLGAADRARLLALVGLELSEVDVGLGRGAPYDAPAAVLVSWRGVVGSLSRVVAGRDWRAAGSEADVPLARKLQRVAALLSAVSVLARCGVRHGMLATWSMRFEPPAAEHGYVTLTDFREAWGRPLGLPAPVALDGTLCPPELRDAPADAREIACTVTAVAQILAGAHTSWLAWPQRDAAAATLARFVDEHAAAHPSVLALALTTQRSIRGLARGDRPSWSQLVALRRDVCGALDAVGSPRPRHVCFLPRCGDGVVRLGAAAEQARNELVQAADRTLAEDGLARVAAAAADESARTRADVADLRAEAAQLRADARKHGDAALTARRDAGAARADRDTQGARADRTTRALERARAAAVVLGGLAAAWLGWVCRDYRALAALAAVVVVLWRSRVEPAVTASSKKGT